MRHIFSSGELLYEQNKKELHEGILEGQFLEYEEVEPYTLFYCIGKINDKDVKVKFTISTNDFAQIKNRHSFGILMQSDIFHADWHSYEILNTEYIIDVE